MGSKTGWNVYPKRLDDFIALDRRKLKSGASSRWSLARNPHEAASLKQHRDDDQKTHSTLQVLMKSLFRIFLVTGQPTPVKYT